MLRQLVIIAAIWFAFASAPLPQLQNHPAQYRDIIPAPVKKFVSEFTEQDLATLRQFYQNYHTYRNDEEAKAALSALSPQLSATLGQYMSYSYGQVASLGPEARAFFIELDRRSSQTRAQMYSSTSPNRAQMKQARLELINKYRAMSPAGQGTSRGIFQFSSCTSQMT
ncbi:nematode fatty acid retinoid binding protein [Ancylostoma duodenale]|uniref:Nematode fatty acid retinoid binding protein n=1 Tax=Ancylostoma duodenale TaxID=51022 RepID=A0A0C2G4L0_9BILA|nr:nematode fatty acid retinoid binding protein [Ancylostoma duodenale]